MNLERVRAPRVRAPELVGRGWLNTDGPVSLRDLRGRFVLLDFWTFCCVNCLHVLDELRLVEEKYADALVVIGVHSPKFVHEADPVALAAAVERYSVHHPVLDDPELVTWQAYTARAWPTLVLIDPEGYVVAQYAGEGHAHAIDALLGELLAEHRERGTLQPGDSPYVAPPVESTDLRFPAKALALPGGGTLVADTGHDQVVELDAEGAVVRRFEGFREPNGLCLLPADVASAVGYDVVVADTVGHRLRGITLASGEVRALAGDGAQWMQGDGTARLSSPWDVAWWQDRVWVAMAGIHQLWTFDPRTGAVAVAAGTTHEGLLDGPAGEAWFAQTSGLAPDGARMWLADSETSSLRYVLAERSSVAEPASVVESASVVEPESGVEPVETTNPSVVEPASVVEPVETTYPSVVEPVETTYPSVVEPVETTYPSVVEPVETTYSVHTAIGSGLFDFGFRDGSAEEALLQHPLGVTVLPDGSVAVSDTYNGAIRRYAPASGEVTTLATDLAEPSGAYVDGEHLVVVESGAHRLTRLPLGAAGRVTEGFAHSTQRPVTEVSESLRLVVSFEPPPGQKVDDRFGPPSQLVVEATPASLIKNGDGRGTDLTRTITLDSQVGEGVLHIAARAASCDVDGGEGAACRMHQQDWGVPIRINKTGDSHLVLPLGGQT